jgi:diketogulonate reductase-like aldo/keto reductase
MASANLIYGTAWKGSSTYRLVQAALDAGFHAFDTAAQPKHYREDLSGRAVRDRILQSRCARSRLWIQTKFTALPGQDPANIPYDAKASIMQQVAESVNQSLAHMETASPGDGYLDCVLLHAPLDTLEDTIEAWKALEVFVPSRIRCLGISNVSFNTLANVYRLAYHKPCIVQNRFRKNNAFDNLVRAFCRRHEIVYQAFGILKDESTLMRTQAVRDISLWVEVTQQQALYGLLKDLNVVALNGTASVQHMEGDMVAMCALQKWSSANCDRWRFAVGALESTMIAEGIKSTIAVSKK